MTTLKTVLLMAVILFAILLGAALLNGCARKEAPEEDTSSWTLEKAQAERDRMVSAFKDEDVTRCDRITFVALMDAFGKRMDIGKYESPEGKWNRDIEACFPEESDSECSRDGYLSVLHAIVSRGDSQAAQRMSEFLREHEYRCGEGAAGVTDISIFKDIIDRLAGGKDLVDEIPFLEGFRGHLLATYIWLRWRVFGGMPIWAQASLTALVADHPSSPYFQALFERFVGPRTGKALAMLEHFPSPYDRYWGSAPDSVIYAMTVELVQAP